MATASSYRRGRDVAVSQASARDSGVSTVGADAVEPCDRIRGDVVAAPSAW